MVPAASYGYIVPKEVFMNYSIGNKIGDDGGFGEVHVCFSELGEKYAIKILKNMENNSAERFKKEIRLIMRLSHPNIIKIIAYNADSDQKFYIMPLYNSSLKTVLPSLYSNYERQYRIISEILNGVIYLHSEGVIHRDLKPENILYNSDSDIAINDFGFGRQVDSKSTRLTSFGVAFGTLRYTAPEQFIDASNVTEKADIFSLGKIIEDIVTNLCSVEIPTSDFEYIIRKCTEENQDKRFNSVAALKETVDNVYQRLLKIVENDEINNQLLELQLGKLNDEASLALARCLLSCGDNDKMENYFRIISNQQYQYLENVDYQLAETLITRLQKYYTLQAWSFGYTDTIGNNCLRLYVLSSNVNIRANLLFTIIEVGISHNRWHVMGIASNLLKSAIFNIPECAELAGLLSGRCINLDALNVDRATLPLCLQPFYNRTTWTF